MARDNGYNEYSVGDSGIDGWHDNMTDDSEIGPIAHYECECGNKLDFIMLAGEPLSTLPCTKCGGHLKVVL